MCPFNTAWSEEYCWDGLGIIGQETLIWPTFHFPKHRNGLYIHLYSFSKVRMQYYFLEFDSLMGNKTYENHFIKVSKRVILDLVTFEGWDRPLRDRLVLLYLIQP